MAPAHRHASRFVSCRAAGALVSLTIAAATPTEAQVWETGQELRFGYEDESRFGAAIAVGDFDADGIADLAVAGPFDDQGDQPNVGYIEIFRGDRLRRFNRLTSVQNGDANDSMGWAIAAADVDAVPGDELIAGVPVYDGNGGLFVLYGLPPGGAPPELVKISEGELAGLMPGTLDNFGVALAVGDFNDDGYEDVAAGAPYGVNPARDEIGRVSVLYGGSDGLDPDVHQTFFAQSPQELSLFGKALAAGDFNGDGFDDLAIGAPWANVGAHEKAGLVEVRYGSILGLQNGVVHTLDQGDVATLLLEEGDHFGAALAAGDFDRSLVCGFPPCADDLAIGSPEDDLGSAVDAGVVAIDFGVVDVGLADPETQVIDQPDVGDPAETGDHFGSTLTAGPLDARTILGPRAADDLIIGVPFEDVGQGVDTLVDAGAAHLLFGSGFLGGLSTATSQYQASLPGYASHPPRAGEQFGSAFGIGDFDDDGRSDVAFGIARLWFTPQNENGGVLVLPGALFADGFERGDPTGWAAKSP
jgi:hypothetical protein